MNKSIVLIALLAFFPQPVQAGRIEPEPVTCWFFRGETLKLKNTCTYESTSWAGGGVRSLIWEDGVRTSMVFGLVTQGPVCKDPKETSVDKVCGKGYARNARTLKRISEAERMKLVNRDKQFIRCVGVKNKSICWLR